MTYTKALLLLTNGYKKIKGRMPEGLDLIKIKQEAKQKVMDAGKVIKVNFDKANNWRKIKAKPEGIETLLNEGKLTIGKAPKTTKIKPGVDPKLTELENIKKIQAENKAAAKRFSEKMNKTKTVEDFIKDGDYDPSGMASGGLAYMLGEEPRSMYNAGGGAGAPPVTYDDNVDNIGPGLTNQGSRPRLNVMPQMRPGKYMENKMNPQPMQNLANGGRIALGKGSKKGVKPAGGLFETLFYNKFHPFLSALNTSEIYDILSPGGGLYADGGRAGYSRGKLVKGLGSLIDYGRRKFLKTTGAAAAGAVGAKTGLFGFKKATPKAVEDIKITMGNEFDGDMDADGMKTAITESFQYLTPLTKKGKQIYNDLIKKKKISKDGNITDSEDAAMIVDDLVKNKKIKLKIGVDDASYHANKKASQTFTSETADQIKNNALAKASGLTDDFGGYGPTKFVDEFHEEIVEMVAPKIVRTRDIKKVKDSITTRLKNMYDARNKKQSGGLANLLGE
jgi:hypothetical protein